MPAVCLALGIEQRGKKTKISVLTSLVCARAKSLLQSCLCATPWTVTRQTPLSMRFPRQEYWSGLPGPPPGDLPGRGMEPVSFMSPALAGGFSPASGSWEAPLRLCVCMCLLSRFCCVRHFATLWAVAHQVLLSMGFCRREYWSGLRLTFYQKNDRNEREKDTT